MTLERNQRAIDDITVGAHVLAAGKTLGLSPDETISTKLQTLRRQQRENRAQRGEREGNRAAAEQFLADNDAAFRAKGNLTPFERQLALGSKVEADIDDQAWAFGEDPQWEKDKQGRKLGKEARRPQDDQQSYTRSEKVRNDVLGEDFLQPQEIEMQKEGRARPQQGIGGMRYSVSDTAEYGDLTRGPRVIDDQVRVTMKKVLEEIQSGAFAEEWVTEAHSGRENFYALEEKGRQHRIEQVGSKLRAMMPWISEGKVSVQEASGGQG